MRGILIIGVLGFLSFSIFQQSSIAKIGEQPLIKINNRVITVDEFKRMSQIDIYEATLSEDQKKEIVDNVIFFELAVQEAKKRGYANLDTVKDELNIALYQSYFNATVKPKIHKIKVDPKQIEAEYKNYPIVDTSHIFIAVPADASSKRRLEAQQKIEQIHKSIASKPKKAQLNAFAEMAKEFSSDPSRDQGGRLGFLGADQALPHYYAEVKKLKPGVLSKPFVSIYGWHLALAHKVLTAKEMGPMYSAFLATKIRTDEGLKIMKSEATSLRKNAKVQVNDDLLMKVR